MQKIKLNIQLFASGTISASSTTMSSGTGKIDWTSSVISGTNKSNVIAILYARRTSGTGTFCTIKGNITINGNSSSMSKYRGSDDKWTTSWKEVGRYTTEVEHAEDGSKKIAISFSISADTGGLNGTTKGSETVTLDKINRASKLGPIEDLKLDDTTTLNITKYITTATDKLEIKFGNTLIKEINNIINGYELTFTTTEQTAIKNLMTSPQATLIFLLTTFNGETRLGTSTQSASITSLDQPIYRNVIKKENGHYQVGINGPVNSEASTLQVYDDDGNDLLFYQPGDTFECDYDVILSGYVTSGTTGVRVSFPSPKRLDNISSITCQSFKCEARGLKGYLNSESGSIEFVGRSGYTISINKSNNNVINFLIVKSSAWTNVDNNTPVVFVAYKGYLKLTFN